MTTEIRDKYKADDILASIPRDRGELFIGYSPVAESEKWLEQFHQTLQEREGRPLSRTVFEVAGNTGGSVVVEVAECASAKDAVEELMETLEENQAADLEPGPESLKQGAFRNPSKAPAGLFFTRANLRISILSQSKEYDGVNEWLDLIHKDLDLAPGEAREGLEISSAGKQERILKLRYSFPWRVGIRGWYKFVSEGGTIERGDQPGELVIDVANSGVSIKGWVLERDRESYIGEFRS